jgi:hypothetical protein
MNRNNKLPDAMTDQGLGVTQDDVEAVKWFRKAARQGLAPAQYNLGISYSNGQGMVKDPAEAVMWYRKAAGRQSMTHFINFLFPALRYGQRPFQRPSPQKQFLSSETTFSACKGAVRLLGVLLLAIPIPLHAKDRPASGKPADAF